MNGAEFITRNERGQTDAALVERFRQAVAKRDRAAVFDGVVREHRDAVLGRCAERLWPDADATVAAARDVLVVAYLAMADPAKLTRPDSLRDWLFAIAAYGELASGFPAGIDAINWAALQASITTDVPDKPDMRGSAARRASLRHWLEQIVATLPEARQQRYDLFVRRALDSRNAARELGTDAAEARRLRRENREAILRAFEVTALAAAEAAPDPLGGETPGCGYILQILADAQRDGGIPEGMRRGSVVLPADLRLGVTRHAAECDACRDRRDDCMAQWAQELLPILAGAELNEQVIEDLRTLPEPGRSHVGAPAGLRLGGSRGTHRGTAPVRTGKATNARRAAVAGAGSIVILALLGFVQPGFLLNTAASAPPSAYSSSPKDPSSGSLSSSGNPQMIGSSEASGRPAPSTVKSSSAGLPPIPGVTATPVPSFVTPTLPAQTTVQPSSSATSSSAQPTATSASPSPSSSSRPSPSASATQPSATASKTPTPSPTPTTPSPTTSAATPAPTPSTSASSTPQPSASPSTSPASASPTSSPAPSTSSAS